jgi:hypothetical protein
MRLAASVAGEGNVEGEVVRAAITPCTTAVVVANALKTGCRSLC